MFLLWSIVCLYFGVRFCKVCLYYGLGFCIVFIYSGVVLCTICLYSGVGFCTGCLYSGVGLCIVCLYSREGFCTICLFYYWSRVHGSINLEIGFEWTRMCLFHIVLYSWVPEDWFSGVGFSIVYSRSWLDIWE